MVDHITLTKIIGIVFIVPLILTIILVYYNLVNQTFQPLNPPSRIPLKKYQKRKKKR